MRSCTLLPGLSAFAACALLLAGCSGGWVASEFGVDDSRIVRYAPSGTRIELANSVDGSFTTTTITVGSASGSEGRYVGQDGAAGSFFPGCWGCGGEMVIDRTVYDALWPLEPGKQAAFVRTGPDGSQAEITIRVVGREKIETPAGHFETLVLDGRIAGADGWSGEMRSWWSPDLGWVVRTRGGDSAGMTISSEVVRVIPPE